MIDYHLILNKLDKTITPALLQDSPTNLLCLKPSDDYNNSDLKVMVFGQETNDWYGEYSGKDKSQWLLDIYDDFFTSKQCFSYGGQFWNGVSKLVDGLENKTNKKIGLLWNNLIKIGKEGDKGRPSDSIIKWQKPAMEFILEEIYITKPDIVVFFTGPNYDDILTSIFNDIEFSEIENRTQRQLAKLHSKHLPFGSIRTYHPTYLWRNDFYQYLDEIITSVISEN